MRDWLALGPTWMSNRIAQVRSELRNESVFQTEVLKVIAQVLSVLGRAQHERFVRRHAVLDATVLIHRHEVVLVAAEQALQIVKLAWVHLFMDADNGCFEPQR